ncbi:MAG: hypothetical protein HY908_08735, partial [Myxococcales bacterium]|nr:hypothetical protein [Myxococcales bacterium]
MTPAEAARLFADLLAAPEGERAKVCTALGLPAAPDAGDVDRARELLDAVAAALVTGDGVRWQIVTAAHRAFRDALALAAAEHQRRLAAEAERVRAAQAAQAQAAQAQAAQAAQAQAAQAQAQAAH